MIMLSKREKETLREISQWKEFYANWKPKTRAKLERMNLVANVSPKGCVENYQLTEKGHSLLQQLTEGGGVLMIPYILLFFCWGRGPRLQYLSRSGQAGTENQNASHR